MLNGVFKNCTSLESIALGSTGLTNVNARLLAGCTSLISVGLPSSLLSIGRRAFANCTSLGALQLPSLTSAVAYRAFEGCTGLAAMVIPAGLMQVNDTAFANCACLPSLYAAGASFCDCNRSLAWPCPAADRAAAKADRAKGLNPLRAQIPSESLWPAYASRSLACKMRAC